MPLTIRSALFPLIGIGMGLTMDEFALWLNLQDVYWADKGRQSIDAVVETLIEAIVLVVLVILVFLQKWRAAVVPVLSLIFQCPVGAGMVGVGFSSGYDLYSVDTRSSVSGPV